MGRMRSYRTPGKLDTFQEEPHIMETNSEKPENYLRVGLMRNGKRHVRLVHLLVLEAFVGTAPEGKPFGLHMYGSCQDNRLERLYWGSAKDNYDDAVAHGTAFVGVKNVGLIGEDSSAAILTDKLVEQIKLEANEGVLYARLQEKYEYTNLSTIIRGLDWGHVRPDLNMPPRHQMTEDERAQVVGLIRAGWTMKEVAREIDFSSSAVSRTFKRETGMSIREFRNMR